MSFADVRQDRGLDRDHLAGGMTAGSQEETVVRGQRPAATSALRTMVCAVQQSEFDTNGPPEMQVNQLSSQHQAAVRLLAIVFFVAGFALGGRVRLLTSQSIIIRFISG